MKLTQYIFTALAFLRPRSSSDESPAAFPRIYRYIVDTWVRRPLAPLISLTAVAALTLHLLKMAYFLPPKISDAAIRRTTSTPQAAPAPKKQQQSLIRTWTERRRTASLGEFMKNMFPSQRPERGGTSRGQGYWEQMENEGKARPRRRMPDSQYSVGDVSADSSHIARWNVPRELSEDQPSGLPQSMQQQQPAVPANSEASSPPNEILPDQSWSWSPHNGSENSISVTKVGGVLQSNYDESNALHTSSLGMDTQTVAEGKQPLRYDLRRARVKARRRERRSLRESGDYLGVQGVNPHTGELDIMSPSESSAGSSASHQGTPHSLMSAWRDIWTKHHRPGGSPNKDEHMEGEDLMISRSLKGKQKVRELNKGVRWKRRVGEWSSLQEPDLSPIAQSLKSASLSSRRPSHVQHPPQAIQQPTDVSDGESLQDTNPPHAKPLSIKGLGSHNAASSPEVTPPTRSSSNSTELHEGESGLDESGSHASSNPADQPENKPFLGIAAERDANQPRAEASNIALSATQSTQSILAFGRKPERYFCFPGMTSMTLFSPDQHSRIVREPPPLTLLEQSPLEATSQLQSTNNPKRALRRPSETHRNPHDGKAIEIKTVKGLKQVIPNIPRAQTSTGPLQEESVTAELPATSHHPHRRLSKVEINQDMRELKEGVAKLDKQWLEQPWYLQTKPGTEHEQTSNILCEILGKSSEIKDPAYIPTIITTGCNRQTPPSASQPEEPIGLDHLLQPTGARQEELNCSVPAVRSSRNNSGNFHSNPAMSSKQNPTSPAEASLVGEPRADTTCLEQESHKMQLGEGLWQGRRSVKAIMMAPEESSLRKSTFIQDQTLQAANQSKNLSAASQDTQQLVPESETSLADHQVQTHSPPEKHRVSPEHGGEDDTESLLPEDQKLETKALNTRPGEKSDDKLEAEEQLTELQRFLPYLKTWAQLYWSTVWPILDLRTLRVPHEGPMPLWKACLLIVLATPAVGLGFVAVVQGMKFVMFVAWLLDYSADDESAIWA
ncbi:uncharacterized protein TRIVIDRAFT_224085 [Trichoderma virens Gv29-8]|uniref:Uncharacterized protein n=1 Tax=Hypocrea virens (strain Gv29-8 / FGSC 10586) TaxID=413071 RepID=G9MZ38_HYPVG|nr:uncharacterized protein TRIVIDRAFT_224085 [Trichoderma virens Gv29-8]EHK20365.1 hypothetical protein TRIVIDRAFT_224085 [Trichoderma virens Gv29-8]